MTRFYQVFYTIKANRQETLHHMYIKAHNAAEARQMCKDAVAMQTGRNAFSRLAIREDDENGQQKVYDFYGKAWVERQNRIADIEGVAKIGRQMA